MARALKDLMDAADDRKLQILWKIRRKMLDVNKTKKIEWTGKWEAVRHLLLPYIEADRVRITGWIEADPISIMQSGLVVCSVHHGGANSWSEATW
jgi:hypothetical protein